MKPTTTRMSRSEALAGLITTIVFGILAILGLVGLALCILQKDWEAAQVYAIMMFGSWIVIEIGLIRLALDGR